MWSEQGRRKAVAGPEALENYPTLTMGTVQLHSEFCVDSSVNIEHRRAMHRSRMLSVLAIYL